MACYAGGMLWYRSEVQLSVIPKGCGKPDRLLYGRIRTFTERQNKLREFEGFIVDGPEYLTIFKGKTGAELDTIRYEPERHDDGLMWETTPWPELNPPIV